MKCEEVTSNSQSFSFVCVCFRQEKIGNMNCPLPIAWSERKSANDRK